jgi:hypothetical protein
MLVDSLPLWGVFLATVALVLGSLEAGFRLGKRRLLQPGVTAESPGVMVGATMGLLAFMLGFTFNSASGRDDSRKNLVIEEVNAIGTTWLRAGLLPEPYPTQARALLREYVDIRVAAVTQGRAALDKALLRSEALQDRLWDVATDAAAKDTGSHPTGFFIASLNDVIDLHLKRLTAGLRSRVPQTIWTTLYALTVVAMVMLGYQLGLGGSRHVNVQLALAVAFSAVLYLIADLDRPQKGLIKVSQQAMIELRDKLDAK